ncbi:MAG: outer membrane lipoprotein carrier protein LolA [Bacteroidales bacterium]|jgi:outer membrane lipoprotein-sorting protein|nr:outer membrane lipoprotein carrier protein LolA [Bacteroidales bacterium]
MRKLLFAFFLCIFFGLYASGQNDPQATVILDKFSAKATSAPSVSIKFVVITTDQTDNTNDTLAGSVVLSKNSYKLDLPDNIVWFNGETSWSYLPAEQEVTITKPDKKDDSFQSHPASIFTMHRNGYKCRLIEERPDIYIIDLYPEEIRNELIRVRLSIAKSSLNLKSCEYKRRDGLAVTLVVKEYNIKLVPEPGMFIFSAEKYKDAEVIDMR